MAKEKPEYRDNFAALIEAFPGRMLLTATDVGKYCGIDRRTAAKIYGIAKEGITIPTLARRMCG